MIKLKEKHIFLFLFTIFFGTLLHYTYKWSGYQSWVGLFSAVNESTWEHLKLLAIPFLTATLIAWPKMQKKYPGFLCIRLISVLIGMFTIITVFYTYTGILGKNLLIADIGTFILGVFVSCFISLFLMQTNRSQGKPSCDITGLFLLLTAFFLFTWMPPHIGLFQDPITGLYGLG